MKEFKEKKLPIGKSKKKVKSMKQAIAIALSEAGLSKNNKQELKMEKKNIDHSKFLNKDGLKKGGIPVEMSKPNETQTQQVGGQRRMLSEKKRSAKWY